MRVEEKPFYLKPPLDVLFKPTKVEKVKPWDVDIVFLLQLLMAEMEKAGIDFRTAGVAVHSSSIIYLRKAQTLMKFDRKEEDEAEEETPKFIPPVIRLPYRGGVVDTSIRDLIAALKRALMELDSAKPTSTVVQETLPEVSFEAILEEFIHRIEEDAESLYEKLLLMPSPVRFSELVQGLSRMEAVRTFIAILFLAQRGVVEVEQGDEGGDFLVYVVEDHGQDGG